MTEMTANTSRRTVAKGLAWSVPVIAVAANAPAAAASPRPCAGDICFGCASVYKCCSGGRNAYYWACVTFTNGGEVPIDVSFEFEVNTSANGVVPFSGGGVVGATSTVTFKPETLRQYGNCSTGTYDSFTIKFSDGLGNDGSAIVPGGSLDGGGNTCPTNTECPACSN